MYSVKIDDHQYSSKQFGIWRIVFGLYLTFYYLRLLPFVKEMFSREGMFLQVIELANTYYPRRLLSFDSVPAVQWMGIFCVLFSILITLGVLRRTASFGLCLITMWFFNRNPHMHSPEYEFINWLILICIFIPIGERFALSKVNPKWEMPKYFYWGAWTLLALGYFHAGTTKFMANHPTWMDGTAMYHVLVTDNARQVWYGHLLDNVPMYFFYPLTWGALISQSFAPVFVSIRRLRPWWWLLSSGVHFGLLGFVTLAQVSWGMLIFHFFVFDPSWVKAWIKALNGPWIKSETRKKPWAEAGQLPKVVTT